MERLRGLPELIKMATALTFVLLVFFPATASTVDDYALEQMHQHPKLYIKITDWSFYTASRVAIIHHVTIENTSSIAYKNIKVKVNYYSAYGPKYGTHVSSTTGVLHITLPPHSKKTYLKGGAVLGAGSMNMRADNIRVLDAIPLGEDGSPARSGKYDLPELTL